MKTIKINESQINEISDVTKLTEYKFYNNVQRFLSDLLKDPVGAKVPFLLQANGITRKQLLYHLKSRDIIKRFQKISDKDSEGKPKTAKMIVRYSVPKKDFAKKMKKLYIDMVAKNVPEKPTEQATNEDERFKDQIKMMKGSPLMMGVIGHPKYRQTDEYAELMNKKIQDKNIDECDGGGAPAGTTNCQSSGAFVQPMFGVQRRKMPTEIEEDTTASTVTQNGDISMGCAVPFGGDKETKDRTPGFSVERQDECKRPSRFNIDGKEVPYKCPKCGGDVIEHVRGIRAYVCENCNERYGVLPIGKRMKDDNIDGVIREAIAREIQDVLLNEENSINKEVDKEANNVYNIICNYKYTEKERVDDDACDTVYQTTLKREFLGKNILYVVRYYVFNDDKRHNLDCACSVIDKYGGTIFINYDLECCPMSYGDLHDSIQHELTHLFKLIMGYGKSSRYKPISEKIVPLINDFYNSPNKFKKVIGCVFYMGLNDEQDAYINGLYASIKNALLSGIQPNEVVKESPLYQKVRELINIKNNLDVYFSNEEFLKYVEIFNQSLKYNKALTKETFLKKINYILERIKKKFFNMIKAYQKFILSGGMIVHGDIVGLIIQQFLS